MAQPEATPLLGTEAGLPDDNRDDASMSETTPLIVGGSSTQARYDGESPRASRRGSQANDDDSLQKSSKSSFGSASMIAITILSMLCLFIAFGAFIVPCRVKDYAQQALVIEPTNLALEAITEKGVRARIQANFRLDGSRVKDDATRRIGRAVTSVVRELGTDETTVSVYLTDFSGALVGTAALPPLSVNVVDGHSTTLDIVTELTAGDAEALRVIANKWLEGKLDILRVVGKAWIPVRSGRLSLGNHSVSEPLVLQGKNVPALPSYEISGLNITDVGVPDDDRKSIRGDVMAHAKNSWPVELTIPSLGFEVLAPNCQIGEDPIHVADATTEPVHVRPKSDVTVSASGIIHDLSEALTKACPGGESSPLDRILEQYLHGEAATFYVRGRGLPGTPQWVTDIMSKVTIPVDFPGREFDNIVRNFSLVDLDFKLPDPFGDPDDPNDGKALISGTLEVVAALPREMNFEANVTSVRASADLFYKSQKLGELHLDHWQPAQSTRIEPTNGAEESEALLKVTSRIENVPLDITDGDVFADVMSKLLFGSRDVVLGIKASVDGTVETVLGNLVIKGIPTEGSIPVKPLPGDGLGSLKPGVGELKVISSSKHWIEVEAVVNITNPTPYTGYIPFVNVHIYKNDSIVGEATAQNVTLGLGENSNLKVRAKWDPLGMGGAAGEQIGRDLISQFISGYDVSVVAKTHRGTIPRLPIIGDSLSRLNVSVEAPTLSIPGSNPDEKHRFIREATFHVLSSTATFTLVSPLALDTVWIEKIDAVALYNHTEPVGAIYYDDLPFPATPGVSRTPKLPVNWSIDSVGYDKLRKALGGELKLDARANVTVRLDRFQQDVWYQGRGIGAEVRL